MPGKLLPFQEQQLIFFDQMDLLTVAQCSYCLSLPTFSSNAEKVVSWQFSSVPLSNVAGSRPSNSPGKKSPPLRVVFFSGGQFLPPARPAIRRFAGQKKERGVAPDFFTLNF